VIGVRSLAVFTCLPHASPIRSLSLSAEHWATLGREFSGLRIIIGDSPAKKPAARRERTGQVVCRFGRKEAVQLTLVKEGGALTVRIQGECLESQAPSRNGHNGSHKPAARKPRTP
jgi:hypothetical protein